MHANHERKIRRTVERDNDGGRVCLGPQDFSLTFFLERTQLIMRILKIPDEFNKTSARTSQNDEYGHGDTNRIIDISHNGAHRCASTQ